VGAGIEPVSKEEGQGVKQTGGTAAETCLEQDKDNIPKTGTRQSCKQALVQAWKQGPKQHQNMVP